jgi:hypothetical protein
MSTPNLLAYLHLGKLLEGEGLAVEAGAEEDVVHVDADEAHGTVIVSVGGDNQVDVLDDGLEDQVELVYSRCSSSRAQSILFMKRIHSAMA